MSIEELKSELKGLSQTRDAEKVLEICNKILEIDKNKVSIIEEKLWVLSYLNRVDEAYEFYKSLDDGIDLHPYYLGMLTGALCRNQRYDDALKVYDENGMFHDEGELLERLERYDEALELYKKLLIKNPKNVTVIDRIKVMSKSMDIDTSEYFDDSLYISWIDLIKSKNDVEICPTCKSKMIPIVYGYPTEETMSRYKRGEIRLGGCMPYPQNYYCRNCDEEHHMQSLNIDCENQTIECAYLYSKLYEIENHLRYKENVSLEELKSKMDYFDDEEFNAFVNKLKEMDFICEGKKGYVRLLGEL